MGGVGHRAACADRRGKGGGGELRIGRLCVARRLGMAFDVVAHWVASATTTMICFCQTESTPSRKPPQKTARPRSGSYPQLVRGQSVLERERSFRRAAEANRQAIERIHQADGHGQVGQFHFAEDCRGCLEHVVRNVRIGDASH